MTDKHSPQPMSLIWPTGYERNFNDQPNPYLIADLNLKPLIQRMSLSRNDEQFTRAVLLDMCTDEKVIAYRQDVIADLLRSPALVAHLDTIHELILTLQGYLLAPQWQENLLQQVAWRLSELDNYVDCVVRLAALLDEAGEAIRSEALVHLRDVMHQSLQDSTFRHLQEELPQLTAQIRSVKSITIGINLDVEMRPLSVILVSANTHRFEGRNLLSRLFGTSEPDAETGIGPLHNARKVDFGGANFQVELRDRKSPFMPALFRDLSDLMDEVSKPVALALRRYTSISTQFLLSLKDELAFYLGAVRLVNRIKTSGLAMERPVIQPINARTGYIQGLYNINLAMQLLSRHEDLSNEIVLNDATFGDDGRIFILTGPNQGGKTTFTQAIGLIQLLFQAGLPVPAVSASLSPVDGIYTHFATEERPELEAGRLGEEAQRLNEVFSHATRQSLILLNETLSSTSASEAALLARDVVRVLRTMGARAIFSTHLHELARDCDEINETTAGDSLVASLVSMVQAVKDTDGQSIKRTYRIVASPPLSKSYAMELAARYGISFEQLTDKLRKRAVLGNGEDK